MARFEFKLPDIGEGVTEGEIVSWLVAEGDNVTEDQEMVEVMTDKATVTIGAPKAGVIAELRGQVGDVIPVGDVLVVFDVGSAGGGVPEQKADEPKPAAPEPAPAPPAAAPAESESSPGGEVVASAVGDIKDSLPGMSAPRAPDVGVLASRSNGGGGSGYFNEKPLAAPATRKLARELDVDLKHVEPSGPGGRVTREDVERHAEAAGAGGSTGHVKTPDSVRITEQDAVTLRPAPSSAPPRSARLPPPAPAGARREDQRVPIRGMRKRIYENMARSMHTAAHFTYVDECEASALREFRARAKPAAEAQGVKLSFLPFIVKAVVAALRRHPHLNCLVDDKSQEMVIKGTYDIGIAAATEAGLVVPVLRNADKLSLLDVAREIDRLADDARNGKTRMEDLGGSSFTITSLGKLGGLFATPIVNYPEVAILGVHEMKKKPVVVGDDMRIGHVMLLSLSFDHRIIDGHVGAAFARDIIDSLETPERLVLELG